MASVNEALRLRADAHTACVRAEGFDFFREPAEVRAASVGPPTQARWSSAIREQGYGATAALAAVMVLRDAGATAEAQYQANVDGLAALSPGDQDAFGETYRRCSADAAAAHPEPGVGTSYSEELRIELERVRQELDANPGFDLIWADWARCMREGGYDFEHRSAAADSMIVAVQELSAEFLQTDPNDPTPDGLRERLDELIDLEDQLIAVDLDCAETTSLDTRLRGLINELEAEALEENGNRWAVLRAAQAQD